MAPLTRQATVLPAVFQIDLADPTGSGMSHRVLRRELLTPAWPRLTASEVSGCFRLTPGWTFACQRSNTLAVKRSLLVVSTSQFRTRPRTVWSQLCTA